MGRQVWTQNSHQDKQDNHNATEDKIQIAGRKAESLPKRERFHATPTFESRSRGSRRL